MIDTINDVRDFFAWGCQDHLGYTLRFEVRAQCCAVLQYTGVVNHQRVLNAVSGIIDGCRVFCGNHVYALTVDNHAAIFVIDIHGAFESAVNAVVFEQSCALLQR